MLFNSIGFLIFFVVVSILYFVLPSKSRWILLLFASCVFYLFFKVIFIFIIFFTIVINYFAGLLIEQQQQHNRKTILLFSSIVINIFTLILFKYFNFIDFQLSGILTWSGYQNSSTLINVLLPVGLSFHTLQAVSYSVEVYRGNQKAESHFGIYALYIMFYPQVAAGPVERPQKLMHQLKQEHKFNYENFKSGLNLMIWGFLKKILVADRISVYVDSVYNNCQQFDATQVAIATFFFGIQIYCDFSAYSDIAMGAARTLGINLSTNFNRPYLSTNIKDFWKRWHISLSTWFRDYIYIPLGGNRVSFANYLINILIVFLIAAAWHYASVTFIIWGLLHAGYLVLYIILKQYNLLNFKFSFITRTLSILFTFLIVNYAWIFFRANTLEDALLINSKFISGNWSLSQYVPIENFGPVSVLLSILFIAYVFLIEKTTNPREAVIFKSVNREIAFAIFNILLTLLFGSFNGQPFIYFRF